MLLSDACLLASGCILWLGFVACEDSPNEGGAFEKLTDQQTAEYGMLVDELSATAGFKFLQPTYLPSGTDWLPGTDYVPELRQATLTFYPDEAVTSGRDRLLIHISEIFDPDEGICPPCGSRDSPDFERGRLGATEILFDSGEIRGGVELLTIYFREDDIRVAATFEWRREPSATPASTDELKEEALRVVQSMLD
jgi:hypothetical protein